MAWGIFFAALSMCGMFVMMVAAARWADDPPPVAGEGLPEPEQRELKEAA